MSDLRYDGSSHTIEILDSSGKSLGNWPAYNNIERIIATRNFGGLTHLQNGTYRINDQSHPYVHTVDPKDRIGPNGIIRFAYQGHSGIGVHGGRSHAAFQPGPQHVTQGCIRTTDEAVRSMTEIMSKDPLQTITITRNNATSPALGKLKHGNMK